MTLARALFMAVRREIMQSPGETGAWNWEGGIRETV